MELELRNLKGTKDYLPEEQILRNKIRKTLEEVFESYGYLPLESPILCYYDVLASKYSGGDEILNEVYKLKDQGERELALRYDLTVPFAKIIGMNPNIRLPFKRYEIGKVFRDGPVKVGRIREFTQCDVDMVGVKSVIAEAELIAMVFEVFKRLELDVYVSYNNRKLLSGIIMKANVESSQVNDVILSLDKIEKIGQDEVRRELIEKNIDNEAINNLFNILQNASGNYFDYFKNNCSNTLMEEGIKELDELKSYLDIIEISEKVKFNPFLARGLDIYTGTVYEIFLTDSSITCSIGAGGRYDKIIGGFLDNGCEYPAVGISFGLDVIYTALCEKTAMNAKSSLDLLIIPLGTLKEAFKITQRLRSEGFSVDIEMSCKKLKKALECADKEKISNVIILGENELQSGVIKLKNMISGAEVETSIADLSRVLKTN